MEPFKVFPILVWEKIMEKLKDPQDKLRLSMTNPSLGALFEFEDNKNEWIFALALTKLLDRCNSEEEIGASINTTILICRKVSRLCQKIVDESSDSYLKKNSCYAPFLPHSCGNFRYAKALSKFLLTMGSNLGKRACPLTRHLTVSIPLREDSSAVFLSDRISVGQEYQIVEEPPSSKEILAELMSKVGKYVRSLDLKVENFFWNVEDSTMELLRIVIGGAPNLEKLKFEWELSNFAVLPSTSTAEDLRKLKMRFPKLPFLKDLSLLEGRSELFLDILNFEQYFPQLRRFFIKFELWREEHSLKKGIFPNLEELHLGHVMIYMQNEKEKFHKLFELLDAPKLNFIWVNGTYEIEDLTKSVTKVGLYWMKKRYPNSEWTYKEYTPFTRWWEISFYRRIKGA